MFEIFEGKVIRKEVQETSTIVTSQEIKEQIVSIILAIDDLKGQGLKLEDDLKQVLKLEQEYEKSNRKK